MPSNAKAPPLGPNTMISLGTLGICVAGLFGFARYQARIEVQTEANTVGLVEVRKAQEAGATDVNKALDENRRDMADLKTLEAATSAKVGMIIDHFDIQPRKRR